MRTENQKTVIKNLKLLSFALWFCVFSFFLLAYLPGSFCLAVTSNVTRHSSSVDLLKGEVRDIVVGSKGTLRLGRSAELLAGEFEDVWSINSIVVSGGTVYVGTSPNGGIYKYSLGELTKIYPAEQRSERGEQGTNGPGDANEPGDANVVEAEQYLLNEHIFAMAIDVAGRLLVGISGEKCSLCRFEGGEMETVFVLGTPYGEPNDAKVTPPFGGTKYIFAITIDDAGNIYLGTGPEGKVYQLDPFGDEPQLIYDSRDKNILSLAAGRDGFVYAGSDSRGLVYKIDPRTKTATVLYDSDRDEITALLFAGSPTRLRPSPRRVEPRGGNMADGELYATATSAEIVQAQTEFAAQLPSAGRPESKFERVKSSGKNDGGLKLEIANMKKGAEGKPFKRPAPVRKGAKPSQASYIYRITRDGFVTDIFSEPAVFFCMAEQAGSLLVGTGNSAQLFVVDPLSEEEAIIYEDEQASQITAVAVSGENVYLGTANPAKLVKLARTFASEGTYTSSLIDAGQPAKWGKLQIEADIPRGCKVMMASRSGNVEDVNDPTFSDWTGLVEVKEPMQLRCPPGRFCQYKLVLTSGDGEKSPLVREIAVADTIPNLAPKVESVNVGRIEKPDKAGMFKISYKAKDDNDDKLIYKIDFRKVGRTNWIELKDELEEDSFEWDGKTVEDGRYEIRITASDERSNTTATKLTGSRISEQVVVDNTGPIVEVRDERIVHRNGKLEVEFKLKLVDELSAIGKLEYTVDSNTDWIGSVPDDSVYDTLEEEFTVLIKALVDGDHVISIKAADAVGNVTYKTFEIQGSAD